jgi:hypothetical protein
MNRTWFDGILEASIRSTKIKSYWPLWLSMHLILHQVGRTHKVVHGKAARFRHLPTACQRRVRWQATVSLRARWALRCYLHVAIGIELAIARSRKVAIVAVTVLENLAIPENSYADNRHNSWRIQRQHHFLDYQFGLPPMRWEHDGIPMQRQVP